MVKAEGLVKRCSRFTNKRCLSPIALSSTLAGCVTVGHVQKHCRRRCYVATRHFLSGDAPLVRSSCTLKPAADSTFDFLLYVGRNA